MTSLYLYSKIGSEWLFILGMGDVCMLKNETYIITGGSSGMGLAMAKQFVKEGANVVITGRDLERLENDKKKF